MRAGSREIIVIALSTASGVNIVSPSTQQR
jgi:hypothetical protein